MTEKQYYVAFDCGNSSVRTVLGIFDGTRIQTELLHQVPNQAMRGVAYEYWDILAIFHEMQHMLKQAFDKAGGDLKSFGISTWGIDFGLLGQSEELLANPLCYRNELGSIGMGLQSPKDLDFLFNASGIQNLPMNSLFQILGMREKLPEYYDMAKSLLLIPDLLNFLCTGEKNSEVSITSTSQLLDMRSADYSMAIFGHAGLSRSLFPSLVEHGTVRGILREDLARRLGIAVIPAISVPSHDTAAAVVSVPTSEQDFAFISSGTWSLIGTELSEPIINEEVKEQGFSNEGGAFGTITLLKNSCGMHILQNIKRELEFNNSRPYSWDEIVDLSQPSLHEGSFVIFDPNDPSLYNPVSMLDAVGSLVSFTDIGIILASAYHSLAVSYSQAIDQLERITGKAYPVIHIIGGGSRNAHLNQMTANLSGRRVIAGPDEATSLGTIAVQVMHAHPELTLSQIRTIIKNSVELKQYDPQ
jgi:rhamnulokinase